MGTVWCVFRTELGWVGLMGQGGRVGRVILPRPSRAAAEAALHAGTADELVETEHDFSCAAEQVRAYFAGERVDFDCELDLEGVGEFDRSVWKAARTIPYGETRSYGWIAERIRRPGAARAVGQSLGRNPVPVIVPCHRVVRSDGALGGFGAGIEWKRRLLRLEGGADCGW